MKKRIAPTTTGSVFHGTRMTAIGQVTLGGRHIGARITQPMKWRTWDTYAVVYVLEGHARYEDEGGIRRSVQSGDWMLMFPGYRYRYNVEPGIAWSEIFIQFRGKIFDLLRESRILNERHPVGHTEPVRLWRSRFEAIIELTGAREPTLSLRRICQLQQLLIDLAVRPRSKSAPAAEEAWLQEAMDVLGCDLHKAPDWEQISRALDVSYETFRKRFRQLTGQPPARYRQSKTIALAGELLKNRAMSFKEIAAKCGFYDEFHFSRTFKQATALTPTQWRSHPF